MKKIKIKKYIIDGKKLKMYINLLGGSRGKPPKKIRAEIIKNLKIHFTTLSIWERSKGNPRINELFWLKEFLGLSTIDQFFKIKTKGGDK